MWLSTYAHGHWHCNRLARHGATSKQALNSNAPIKAYSLTCPLPLSLRVWGATSCTWVINNPNHQICRRRQSVKIATQSERPFGVPDARHQLNRVAGRLGCVPNSTHKNTREKNVCPQKISANNTHNLLALVIWRVRMNYKVISFLGRFNERTTLSACAQGSRGWHVTGTLPPPHVPCNNACHPAAARWQREM